MGSSKRQMRAQLSLLFSDEEMFDNFIVPCKNNRMLHSIILKCLEAYYKYPDLRQKIDGVEIPNTALENENTTTRQESINNIREILLMQGFLAQELQNSMEEGIEEVSDILDAVNQKGVDIGAMQESRNASSGQTVTIRALEDKSTATTPITDNNSMASELADTLKEMKEFMSAVKQSGMMPQTQSVPTEEVATEEETVSETIEEPKKPVVKKAKKVEKKETIEPEIIEEKETPDEIKEFSAEVVAPPPALPKEAVLGEASDALSELLDSL